MFEFPDRGNTRIINSQYEDMGDEGLKTKELSLGWEVSWMIPDDSPGTCYPMLGSCPG